MGMSVDTSKLDESIGIISDCFNDKILETFAGLASVIKAEMENGDNAVMEQAYEQCKKTQEVYNPCIESVKGFFKDVNETIEVADYLEKRANMGSVGSHDAAFTTENLDAADAKL